MDNLKDLIAHAIPFAAVVPSDKEFSMPRIIEAVIVAALVGAGTWMLLIPELKTQLSYVSKDINEIKVDMKDMKSEMAQIQVDMVTDRFTGTDFKEYNDKHNSKHDRETRDMYSRTQ